MIGDNYSMKLINTASNGINPNMSSFINGFLSYIQGYNRLLMREKKDSNNLEDYILSMSKILNYIHNGHSYANVIEALRFLDEYMRIQQMRFGQVKYEIIVDKALCFHSVKRFVLFTLIDDIILRHIDYGSNELNLVISAENKRITILQKTGGEEDLISHIRIKKKVQKRIYNILE
jgi:hypothetical protein